HVPGLVHGHVVSSAIARGTIAAIDTSAALAVPGVLAVLTHDNAPRRAKSDEKYRDEVAPSSGSPFRPLASPDIQFSGQPIALVVAESLELARHAASLVRVEYRPEPHQASFERTRLTAREPDFRTPPPEPRGDAAEALAAAPVTIEAEYRAPAEHHSPMESFAATVVRHDDGTLTVYDKTQGVLNVRDYLCHVFGYRKSQLRVVSPFVGGAFGSGLRPQYHVFLAVLAARELERSVRVALTRQQMFTFGHRPATWQRLRLGASSDGTLQALTHEAVAETSRFEDFNEAVVNWSGLLYRCDNVAFDHKVAPLDVYTPMDMRAPGASWGVFALECAMDELAAKLGTDPLELRLKNYAERDQNEDRPFSSKELRACYRQGAERFGWARRDPRPRSMRAGEALVGWGMATGVWEAYQEQATARAVLTDDGRLTVSSATADIGTGTYTIMTQIAAETLGLPVDAVTFQLGDSTLPASPIEGGSATASSVGPAVKAACEKVRRRLDKLARSLDGAGGASVQEVMRRAGVTSLDEKATVKPAKKQERHSLYTHSAVFAEVHVDEDLGTVRVTRVVSAVAAGRILNPKTARSQVLGGVVWGIGMALQEESVLDDAVGRFMTHNLADYHVPVHADVHDVDVIFVDERDEIVNPLGVKGVGEIGLVGVAAAIANAVYHATGRRVRDLPITLDKLL
ncbi:MAG TPA: xanthine dehydrogenase family protein molybdopterin-binding subunit, partial [Solirubrobacteraceae bacterium]